jgi:hypothetical protein
MRIRGYLPAGVLLTHQRETCDLVDKNGIRCVDVNEACTVPLLAG